MKIEPDNSRVRGADIMSRWNYPLDPECPVVARQNEKYAHMEADPITIHYGVDVGEFREPWENKHRTECNRCQEFGAANVEVDG